MEIVTRNPATGKILSTYEQYTQERVLQLLERSHEQHLLWKQQPLQHRAALLQKLAVVLRKHSEEYATLMSQEMGKPIRAARAEIEKCAWTCEVYMHNAESWLAEEQVQADGIKHRVIFEPLGIILAIMPWNFPFWQVIRFLVPTLLVGNGALLKHASNVSGSALKIQEAIEEAGFPKGLFSTIIASHDAVAKVIEHPHCQGVSLTGSTAAGKRITELAGKHLKKVVMELGGSDPFIVLADAHINEAAQAAIVGRFQNNGQSCIAAKRFIVHQNVIEEFVREFQHGVAKLSVGDQLDEETDIGPLIDERAAQEMDSFITDATSKGAKVLIGAKRDGAFFHPTILTNVTLAMHVVNQEVFGPIAPIIVVQDDEEAIRIANSTEFGLGASVWSADLAHGERVARQLDAGAVFVNSITKSDPRMPFGGIKQSGLGRELSHWGLKEFANIKAINIYKNTSTSIDKASD